MKLLAASLFLLSSVSAFAISDQKLVDKCFPVAQAKMIAHAQKLECKIVEKDPFYISRMDNRTLNPFKYLEWKLKVDCPDEEITEITAVTQWVSYEKRCI